MKPSTADLLWSLAITLAIVGLHLLGQPADTPMPDALDVATLQFALLACVKLDRLLKDKAGINITTNNKSPHGEY